VQPRIGDDPLEQALGAGGVLVSCGCFDVPAHRRRRLCGLDGATQPLL